MKQATLELMEKALITGGISGFWGCAFYLYQVSKWIPFKFWMFIINIVLAFFVGYVLWEMLPVTQYTNGLIAIWWFSTYPFLAILESKGVKILEKMVFKK